MSRYDGYTEPLEVLVEILRELKKMNERLTVQEIPKEVVKPPVNRAPQRKTQPRGKTK